VPQNEAEAKQQPELTPRERAALERLEAADPIVRFFVSDDDGKAMVGHPIKAAGFALFMQAVGTTNDDFANGLIKQMRSVTDRAGHLDLDKLHYQLAIITSKKPRDEVEAVLMAKFAALNSATMKAVERYMNIEHMVWKNHESRVQSEHMSVSDISKLARTTVMLLEGFTRYRAAIGKAEQPEGEAASRLSQTSPPTLTKSESSPMPIMEQPTGSVVTLAREPAKRNGHARR